MAHPIRISFYSVWTKVKFEDVFLDEIETERSVQSNGHESSKFKLQIIVALQEDVQEDLKLCS